jgi:hypothetical protein
VLLRSRFGWSWMVSRKLSWWAAGKKSVWAKTQSVAMVFCARSDLYRKGWEMR